MLSEEILLRKVPFTFLTSTVKSAEIRPFSATPTRGNLNTVGTLIFDLMFNSTDFFSK